MSEMNVRKSLSEQIPRASSNKTSEHASQSEAADRKSLSERIAQANAARIDGAWSTPDEQLVEAERRTPFQICDVYCAHAEELLAITGQISAALPSRAAYLARTNRASGDASGQPLDQGAYPGREPRVRLRLGDP